MLCPPVEDYPNPGKEAQEEEEGVKRLGSGASTSCMMRPEMNIRWTMQVSCTSPSDFETEATEGVIEEEKVKETKN